MSGFELVAAVMGAFFVTGFIVGAILVVVLPAALRRRRSQGSG